MKCLNPLALRQEIEMLIPVTDGFGFGLPPIKQEGMCFSYEHPNLVWDGYREIFNTYFYNTYGGTWYLKPVLWLLRKISFKAWSEALFINAKILSEKSNANTGY